MRRKQLENMVDQVLFEETRSLVEVTSEIQAWLALPSNKYRQLDVFCYLSTKYESCDRHRMMSIQLDLIRNILFESRSIENLDLYLREATDDLRSHIKNMQTECDNHQVPRNFLVTSIMQFKKVVNLEQGSDLLAHTVVAQEHGLAIYGKAVLTWAMRHGAWELVLAIIETAQQDGNVGALLAFEEGHGTSKRAVTVVMQEELDYQIERDLSECFAVYYDPPDSKDVQLSLNAMLILVRDAWSGVLTAIASQLGECPESSLCQTSQQMIQQRSFKLQRDINQWIKCIPGMLEWMRSPNGNHSTFESLKLMPLKVIDRMLAMTEDSRFLWALSFELNGPACFEKRLQQLVNVKTLGSSLSNDRIAALLVFPRLHMPGCVSDDAYQGLQKTLVGYAAQHFSLEQAVSLLNTLILEGYAPIAMAFIGACKTHHDRIWHRRLLRARDVEGNSPIDCIFDSTALNYDQQRKLSDTLMSSDSQPTAGEATYVEIIDETDPSIYMPNLMFLVRQGIGLKGEKRAVWKEGLLKQLTQDGIDLFLRSTLGETVLYQVCRSNMWDLLLPILRRAHKDENINQLLALTIPQYFHEEDDEQPSPVTHVPTVRLLVEQLANHSYPLSLLTYQAFAHRNLSDLRQWVDMPDSGRRGFLEEMREYQDHLTELRNFLCSPLVLGPGDLLVISLEDYLQQDDPSNLWRQFRPHERCLLDGINNMVFTSLPKTRNRCSEIEAKLDKLCGSLLPSAGEASVSSQVKAHLYNYFSQYGEFRRSTLWKKILYPRLDAAPARWESGCPSSAQLGLRKRPMLFFKIIVGSGLIVSVVVGTYFLLRPIHWPLVWQALNVKIAQLGLSTLSMTGIGVGVAALLIVGLIYCWCRSDRASKRATSSHVACAVSRSGSLDYPGAYAPVVMSVSSEASVASALPAHRLARDSREGGCLSRYLPCFFARKARLNVLTLEGRSYPKYEQAIVREQGIS